ncbi:MAG TPA: helix-turn-helix transcriptional regulator [Actinomycetes bacterium]
MAKADLKLLGEAIRGFRERAQPERISQFRLATLLQWQGTAPIVEIEKGRRRPRPETLAALGEALRLPPADLAYLHGLAGYRPATVMPPTEQVKRVLGAIEPDLARRTYPVHVLDFQFRHWMVNAATAALVGGSVETLRELLRRGVHGFDVVFDSRLPTRRRFTDPEAVERERVFRFKSHNLYRRFEPFYLAYPECMRARLRPADYARFVRCWNEVEVGTDQAFPVHPEVTVRLGPDAVTFAIHMVELLQADRLLYVGYFEPKDAAGNRQRCEAYFARHQASEHACIKSWDFHDDGPPPITT